MASSSSSSSSFRVLLLLSLVCSCCLFSLVACTEFKVGDKDGWEKPKSKSDSYFNDWASENRFQINDTLRFKYDKDSVMVVTEDEYKKCETTKPLFFANNGDTVFRLNRPGLFYFISGVSGHCEKGMKMIVKVLNSTESQAAGSNAPPPPNHASRKTGGFGTVFTVMLIGLVSVSVLVLV